MTLARVRAPRILDLHPPSEAIEQEVLRGLRARPKMLPPKLLYDRRGSELFERICDLDEYYPTRTELGIMRAHLQEMSHRLGPRCVVIECGSGSSRKTRLLLSQLDDVAAYLPIEISKSALLSAAERLRSEFPDLAIVPVRADFTRPLDLPQVRRNARRRVVFFPGSTIGNFSRMEAQRFLQRLRALSRDDGALLIGVDLRKDVATLERAYNDSAGVTAAFNLNLLRRFNRELAADFDLRTFQHKAVYNHPEGRIEMHLISLRSQVVRVAGVEIPFEEGETIHTESSHKYGLEEFGAMAAGSGFDVDRVWTDDRRLFSVHLLIAA